MANFEQIAKRHTLIGSIEILMKAGVKFVVGENTLSRPISKKPELCIKVMTSKGRIIKVEKAKYSFYKLFNNIFFKNLQRWELIKKN